MINNIISGVYSNVCSIKYPSRLKHELLFNDLINPIYADLTYLKSFTGAFNKIVTFR